MYLQVLPWEESDRQGISHAFFQTIRWFYSAPVQAFESLVPSSPMGPALGFAVLGGSLGTVANLMWNFTARVLTQEMDDPSVALLRFTLIALAAPLLAAVGVTLNAGLSQLVLILIGAPNNGLGATFQSIGYASGAGAILQVVPVLGAPGAFAVSLAFSGIGLYKLHGMSPGQAVAIVLLPLLLLAGIGLGLALTLMGMENLISTLPSLPLY